MIRNREEDPVRARQQTKTKMMSFHLYLVCYILNI